MTWGQAVALGLVLWAWAAWNAVAYLRRRLRERQAAALLAGDQDQAMAITRDEQGEERDR